MNEPTQAPGEPDGRGQRLLETIRLLSEADPTAFDRVEEFVWSLVGRQLKWSYDDPASCRRAAAFAALDPCLRRESEAINRDFAGTEADGLHAVSPLPTR